MTSKRNPFWCIIGSVVGGIWLGYLLSGITSVSEPVQDVSNRIEVLMALLLLLVVCMGVIVVAGMGAFG